MYKRFLILLLSFVVFTSCTRSMIIVRDGKPFATIVIEKTASNQIKTLAKLLQTYVQKSTGATLPISDHSVNGISLHLGRTAFVKQNIKINDLDSDGFLLQAVDQKNYVIVGGSDWGTEFGVYEFLERFLGIRWLMPTETGTDIPTVKTLNVQTDKIVENPVYLSRQFSPININSNNTSGQWGRFNRARQRVVSQHNLMNLFPPQEFARTNPDFYPILKGKRFIPKPEDKQTWQPNFSANGIIDAAANKINDYFAKNPAQPSFSLGINDSQSFDQSPQSIARRNGKKNYLGLEDVSDDYFMWANAVVQKVVKNYPDKLFGTLAYSNVVEPPTKVKINRNLIPFITYEYLRWNDPALQKSSQNLTERWGNVAEYLGWYDYAYGLSYLLPRVGFHKMGEYLSWGAAHKVRYYYAELYPNWGEGPKAWLLAKLLWNPKRNVDDLLDDWYSHFAGASSGAKLKEFYAIWETFWAKDIQNTRWNKKSGLFLPFNDPSYLSYVPDSYIIKADALMNDALKLADSPQRKARVKKLNEMWQIYKNAAIVYKGNTRKRSVAGMSEQGMAKLLDSAKVIVQASKQFKSMLNTLQKDPVHSQSVNNIIKRINIGDDNWGSGVVYQIATSAKGNPQMQDQISQFTESIDLDADDANISDRKAPGKNEAEVKQKSNNIVNGLKMLNGKAELVSGNASFEDGLKGWRTWEAKGGGKMSVSNVVALEGRNSFLAYGVKHGGPYQIIPYKAGSFIAVVNCFVPKDYKGGTAMLQVQVMDKSNAVLKDAFSQPPVVIALDPGEWSAARISFVLPKEKKSAEKVRIVVTLDGFSPDRSIFLDNMGIYKVD